MDELNDAFASCVVGAGIPVILNTDLAITFIILQEKVYRIDHRVRFLGKVDKLSMVLELLRR